MEVSLNGDKSYRTTNTGLIREDMATTSNPEWKYSGWELSIPSNQLPKGSFTLSAVAATLSGEQFSLKVYDSIGKITIVPGPFRPTPASIASYFVAILFGMFIKDILKKIL